MVNRFYLKRKLGMANYWRRLRRNGMNQGQAMVEFAMISAIALVIMLVGIQYALIGQAALAVSQGASALARYASVNPGAFGTNNGTATLPAAASQLLSPTINDTNLTVSIASLTPTGATQTSTPRPQADQVKITVSYNATNKLALPNPFMAIPPLFPGITFPTALSSTDIQMYEN